ncbi:MAG: type II and III secretion system protein family protein [Sinimarinibacterium flocculans]|uniref:type II and III secretion system protein family protein n=1 Tax=Sinimarinibacterium flocculans TaxID=985250 RepID=UPI00249235E0|nr:type II and III secretion system protein family protein [Sinimarinibacterium flocculans]MEC9362077.1 type II and III secretion system protein family protein [Pseudomonadota bacterium]
MERAMERGAFEQVRALVRVSLACLALIVAMPAASAETVLMVELGTQRLHRAAGDIGRVAVGNPAIADVSVINRRELMITGNSLGITSLHVWTKGSPKPSEYRIRVGAVVDPSVRSRPDPELAGATIDQGRSVSGRLPNLLAHRRAAQAGRLAEAGEITDSSGVELETQVMTTVKIAEVGRSTMRRYGLHASKATGGDSGGLFAPGSLSGVEQNAGDGAGIEFLQNLPIQNAFNLVLADPGRGLLGIISLLEGKGLVRVLAEPSLLAMSGQTATYLAGGEFPVPVSQGGATAGGISIQYKEFGVRLAISPTVLARERIAMKVAPEVSDLDFSAGIQIGGVSVPALSVRRTETTIELGDGETFVISGLVSSNLADNVNKVPWLGDIPIIGAFFKSNDLQREDRELIMVVTPRLVRPLAKGARLPKLPGSEYDRYEPSAARTIFLERGDFDSGFSR